MGVFNWLPGALIGALVGWNFDRIIRRVKGESSFKRAPHNDEGKTGRQAEQGPKEGKDKLSGMEADGAVHRE